MFSKTAIGAVISIVVILLNAFGVVLPEGAETSFVEAIATIVGIGMLVWGQLARKDLVAGVIRR